MCAVGRTQEDSEIEVPKFAYGWRAGPAAGCENYEKEEGCYSWTHGAVA